MLLAVNPVAWKVSYPLATDLPDDSQSEAAHWTLPASGRMSGDNTMSTEQEDKLAKVWHEVRTWSMQARVALASRILQSLEQEQTGLPRQSPTDLIGVWKTEPPPSDTEVEQLLEEEKMKKYR